MYRRGRRFEYKVKKYLEGKGYTVLRCAASKPVDLVAIKDGRAILIECKTRETKKIPEKLVKLSKESGADVLVFTPSSLARRVKRA